MPIGNAYKGKVMVGKPDGTDLQELAICNVPLDYDCAKDNIYVDLKSWETTIFVKNKRRLLATLGLLLSRGEKKMKRKKLRKWRKYARRYERNV